jgi:hypothetical protein
MNFGYMKIYANIHEVTLTNDSGFEVEGVKATCSLCNYSTESYGSSYASRKRCLVLLRLQCPRRETHFYIANEP